MLIMNIEKVTEIEITVGQRAYREEEGRDDGVQAGLASHQSAVMSHICSSFQLLTFLLFESLEEGS